MVWSSSSSSRLLLCRRGISLLVQQSSRYLTFSSSLHLRSIYHCPVYSHPGQRRSVRAVPKAVGFASSSTSRISEDDEKKNVLSSFRSSSSPYSLSPTTLCPVDDGTTPNIPRASNLLVPVRSFSSGSARPPDREERYGLFTALDDKNRGKPSENPEDDGRGSSAPMDLEKEFVAQNLAANATPESSRLLVFLSISGNFAIAAAKFYAYSRTGHIAMFTEAVHTLVDVGNQAILGWGFYEATRSPDVKHQYGYGRAAFFYSLISALGTFGFGALYTFYTGVNMLLHPAETVVSSSIETWGVLGVSFLVDGYVLTQAVKHVRARAAETRVSALKWVTSFKDPFTVAVLFEDSAAVLGVLIAAGGIGLTHLTGSPLWDGLASIAISGLLATVSLKLVALNRNFILGKPVDFEVTRGILSILRKRRSIDGVFSVKSQWVGPSAFSYKAEVDFDGTWLASQIYPEYAKRLVKASEQGSIEKELQWMLPCFAEDITRVVEKEVDDIRNEIHRHYKEATFIEIVPDSSQSASSALAAMSDLSKSQETNLLVSLIGLQQHSSSSDVEYLNLANTYLMDGLYEKALLPLQSCLELREKKFGKSHPEVATVVVKIGQIHEHEGRLDDALAFYKQALGIYEGVAGTSPSEEVPTLCENIARVLRLNRRDYGAVPYLEKAFQSRLKTSGLNSEKIHHTLSLIVDLFKSLPAHSQDRMRYLWLMRQNAESVFGPSSKQALNVMLEIGSSLSAMGHYADAIKAYSQALESLKNQDNPPSSSASPSPSAPSVTVDLDKLSLQSFVLTSIADCYYNLDQMQKAKEFYESALSITVAYFGNEHVSARHLKARLQSLYIY